MKKIGIIITTFERTKLLSKCLYKLVEYLEDNWRIIIIDQSKESNAKKDVINDIRFTIPDLIHYEKAPFNSGLSYCRNFGVEKAKELGCEYVVIGSDSFLFNESIKRIEEITKILYSDKIDKCGFQLYNCCCGWEAKLNLIEGKYFELDFVDLNNCSLYRNINEDIIPIWEVDICRNFFVATTKSLLDVKWNENFKLGEHEDHCWRYKLAGYKTLWTNFISASKMTDRPDEYVKYRKENFKDGLRKLREKYNISGWVQYKHLSRAKNINHL